MPKEIIFWETPKVEDVLLPYLVYIVKYICHWEMRSLQKVGTIIPISY